MTTLGGIAGTEFRSRVRAGFRRRQPESPLEWMPKHIRFPDGWEETRFDFDRCPHVRGFIELFVMDPTKRKANLPWATRLAKTTTLEGLIMWKADQDPVPMAALFPDNDSLAAVDDHLYPVFEACAPINAQLLPTHLRNKRSVKLRDCTIRLASGGKKSSVSGFPSQWVVKFEHDKTNLRKSSEGDPSARLDSRTSGFCRNVKIMEEGTPCDKHQSRAYAMMIADDVQQVRYWVPCPHCKQYQILQHDNIEWSKNEHGKSEAGLAEKTAWYKCSHKGCRIDDHHRVAMMQAGRWLIDGQRIDKKGRITGTPTVDSDTMCFGTMTGPMSKLYSLLIKGWGTIASELVAARHAWALGSDKLIRKCYAETLGLPWDPQRRTVRTNDLAVRLRSDDHPERGIVPPWASFLTFTSDVGKIADELIFYWMVIAWGGIARGGIVDWGIWQSRESFLKEWAAAQYPIGTDQINVFGQPSCIDSGSYSLEMYELCKPIKNCYPCKGDTKSKVVDLYHPGYQRQGLSPRELELKKKANAHDLLYINSNLTQEWRVALTEGRITSEMPGFVSLPADVCDQWQDHEDFLEELTADAYVEGKWIGENNEFGDTLRYGRALAECYTGNGKRWGKIPLLSNSSRNGPRFFSRSGATPQQASSKPFVEGFR